MIYGLFSDPRAWETDFLPSSFWNPDKYGVHIDLHTDVFRIPETDIDKKYSFFLTSEVWEIPMQKTLDYLRGKGIKIFLIAREPIKFNNAVGGMFSFEKFKYNGQYYFTPDAVFAVCNKYAKLWEDKTKTYVTGYPRWDWCVDKSKWKSRAQVDKQYGIRSGAKIIFFPSYPPYAYKKIDGKDTLVDIFESRESILEAGVEFAKENTEYQFVSKIHPMSMKCYLKQTGPGRDVSGLLEKYYKNPTAYTKVIGDQRMSSDIMKDLLIHSSLIVGLWSTVMLDAVMLRKPIIQAIMGNNIDMFDNPFDGMFEICGSKNELLDAFRNCESGKYDASKTTIEKTEEYIQGCDGLACERICEAIKKEMTSK